MGLTSDQEFSYPGDVVQRMNDEGAARVAEMVRAKTLLFDIYIDMCESQDVRMGGKLWLELEKFINDQMPEKLKDTDAMFKRVEAARTKWQERNIE